LVETVKLEVGYSSETFVSNYKTTLHLVPGYHNPNLTAVEVALGTELPAALGADCPPYCNVGEVVASLSQAASSGLSFD
jgi:hypothetical protein